MEKHFAMYELCQIMRQRESPLFAEILNRLREGKHSSEDLRLIKQRLISEEDANYPSEAPHLFIQNKKVEKLNKKCTMFLMGKSIQLFHYIL